jgi:hypothetical protein
MSTGLKIVLWIAGIIGGLLVLIVIAGIFLGKSMVDDVNEAQAFAANASHEQCVDEMAKRINGCDGVNCIMQTSVFGGTCLAGAKGDREQFCATVPAQTDEAAISAWSTEFCSKREMNSENCGVAAGIAIAFCSGQMSGMEQK